METSTGPDTVTENSETNPDAGAESVAGAMAGNDGHHEDAGDCAWDSAQGTRIVLNGGIITADGEGDVMVNAQGDGLKSDNEEDTTRGYILIEGGAVQVTSGGDAIQAQTDVLVMDGEIVLSSGGGAGGFVNQDTSAKGIKGVVNVNIDGGTFTINSADDAIHSNGSIVINGGTFRLASGDDGMHADSTLEINGGDIRISESYEGIESAVITINDGEIHIVSWDDGLNVAAGNDGSGANWGPGMGPGGGGNLVPGGDGAQVPGARPGRGGGGPGQDAFAYAGDYYLYINGGHIAIDAGGDGLDANGSIGAPAGLRRVMNQVQQ